MLHLKTLNVDYGNFKISIDNMTLNKGIHVLVGENGSGKSSVLTSIVGYNTPSITAREINIENMKVDRTSDYISYLPQQNMPFQMMVIDFIQMTADKRLKSEEINKTLAYFKLVDYKHTPIEMLSGGEFKRALCAQIHLEDKQILMFDEIEQGLDVNYQHLVMGWLKELSQHKTIVLAMHDLNLAFNYADTITCMQKGTLTEVKVPLNQVTPTMLSKTFSRDMDIVDYRGRKIIIS